ncbi:MAG: metalloregulator ArsR/SmtB family transcription factor [Actinomycetota bacterium]|nr:metalloregulator ArsR/SmtB family transcription factor [Actinomycetota bacterium]
MTTPVDADGPNGQVFAALADPTRRAVLEAVAAAGARTATELAAELPVSRQAIAKHLGILQEAGLVATAKVGREQRYSVTPAPLVEAGSWLLQAGRAWDRRLARLEQMATARHGNRLHGG